MLIKYTVITTKSLVLVKPMITNHGGLLKTFLVSKNFSGKRPLKWPVLGSADKYTTLLPLAWPIKPVFHLRMFLYEAAFC